ncbi:hypothetical protein MASR1M12_19150 [Erysipelotrichia bacterium]
MALAYLESLGVNPSDSIKQIIISHFHDDHIRGLAATIEKCPNAQVWYPAPMTDDTFMTLVSLAGEIDSKHKSGIKELEKTLEVLEKNKLLYKQRVCMVLENTEILNDPSKKVCMRALSPSTTTIGLVRSVVNAQSLIKKATIDEDELNFTSIAISAKLGKLSFLLGSDLECCSKNNDIGWGRVLEIFPGQPCFEKSRHFKIPHHGSENGDHPRIWEDLVESQPRTVCTRFNKKSLPLDKDVERIKKRSFEAYLTSFGKNKKRGTVRLLGDFDIETNSSIQKDGFVRFRFDENTDFENVTVDPFGSARKL